MSGMTDRLDAAALVTAALHDDRVAARFVLDHADAREVAWFTACLFADFIESHVADPAAFVRGITAALTEREIGS